MSLQIRQGECLGLVGESGCGKSTLAFLLAGFLRPDEGELYFLGRKLEGSGREAQHRREGMQMVFQDPASSLNPYMTIGRNLMEALRYWKKQLPQEEQRLLVKGALEQAGLPAAFMDRRPHQLSGGECQRAAIARALLAGPKLLICDEVTSALDMSVQAEIMRLLTERKEEKEQKLSMLFITHDTDLAAAICDRIAVMEQGRIRGIQPA